MSTAEGGKPEDLRTRTKRFALWIIRLYCALPKSVEAQVLGKQVLRSGTSVGAHYAEALRARSTAEFLSKMEAGLQELEETRYWLELLGESGIVSIETIDGLMDEARQLVAILITCAKNARARSHQTARAGSDGNH